jgi:hypothetical protein
LRREYLVQGRRVAFLIVVVFLALGLVGGIALWRQYQTIPASLPGPNLLPNSDFAADSDGDGIPDGWMTAGVGGVQLSGFRVITDTGHALQITGVNNFVKSPYIAVQPDQKYRLVFQALADDPAKPSPTRVRARFHWRDVEGLEFSVVNGDWQDVPHRSWASISTEKVAPAGAAHLAISIHPASDDRIIIDRLGLGQIGVRVAPWPDGKNAAMALSFDYETAMGGLIHSRSVDDPLAGADALARARNMRAGVDEILRLFAPQNIRGTWYVNGYNFLNGNREGRTFMGDPIYEWANRANRWPTDFWTEHPWFSPDPMTDEQTDPEWYFGSQIATLQAAGQDLQSHTFAHFDGGLVEPSDWRDDFKAWNDVAAPMNVTPATSLAFPWSSSAGMRWDSWAVLEANGIRSLTRTNWRQPRYRLADRETFALRPLPGRETITVIADEYLTPRSLSDVQAAVRRAELNEGAIDVWAHTEEVTTDQQLHAWSTIIESSSDFWVASVPDIVTWHQAINQVEVRLFAEEPYYHFQVRNGSRESLHGVTLSLPFAPERVEIGGREAEVDGDTLILDLPARHTIEVRLWRA